MFEVVNLAITDSEQLYTFSDDVASAAFHAVGGDIVMRSESAGDDWTIRAGEKESIDTRALQGQTVYFVTTTTATLQIRLLKGLMS